jgi:hypothetical protein
VTPTPPSLSQRAPSAGGGVVGACGGGRQGEAARECRSSVARPGRTQEWRPRSPTPCFRSHSLPSTPVRKKHQRHTTGCYGVGVAYPGADSLVIVASSFILLHFHIYKPDFYCYTSKIISLIMHNIVLDSKPLMHMIKQSWIAVCSKHIYTHA